MPTKVILTVTQGEFIGPTFAFDDRIDPGSGLPLRVVVWQDGPTTRERHEFRFNGWQKEVRR